jgi:hypothetical protein
MGKTLLSDNAIFLSASEKNSKFATCCKAQRLPLSLRPFYPLPSNLLFTTCFTTSSSLSSTLSPSFSILTPSLIEKRGNDVAD